MREKIQRFMYGRNGADDLARFEVILIWIPILLSLFIRNSIVQSVLWVIMMALFGHSYYRMFSKDIPKRYEENQRFIRWRNEVLLKWNTNRKQIIQRRDYRFYKCPMCKQKVRVPKGHGRICITCPKCREEFIRRS